MPCSQGRESESARETGIGAGCEYVGRRCAGTGVDLLRAACSLLLTRLTTVRRVWRVWRVRSLRLLITSQGRWVEWVEIRR